MLVAPWLPLGSPIWGFTAHVGGRVFPSRVHTYGSVALLSLFGCFSALRLHVSHFDSPVLLSRWFNSTVLKYVFCVYSVVCVFIPVLEL
jgi:hypothetical protein